MTALGAIGLEPGDEVLQVPEAGSFNHDINLECNTSICRYRTRNV